MLLLEKIDVSKYPQEKEKIFMLVDKIWKRKESANQAKDSIDRWGKSRKETGAYFYVMKNSTPIGITGYFIPNKEKGVFGLRHHGVLKKGMGKEALNELTKYLENNYSNFNELVELIPEGREDLIPLFEKWGFKIDPEGVPSWEPKKEYYKYAMRRGVEG